MKGLAWEAAGVVVAIIIFIVPQLPQFTDFASFQVFMATAFASGGFAGSSVLSTGKKVIDFFKWNRKLEERKIKNDAFINKNKKDPANPQQANAILEMLQGRREDFIEEFIEGKEEEEE